VPTSLVVVGAGVIGIEYASMFAALGTRVTVVEKRPSMLDFCDPEVVESLKFHLRDQSVTFRFGEEVEKVEVTPRGTVTSLASGKRIAADMVMYSAGRQGVTDVLHLDKAGLSADDRGRIVVDEHYRTEAEHIYAVGDVIGFPALAATSMDQGRLAAYHAFGEPARELHGLQPIGIYTVPEISYCGKTEAELTKEAVPYEVGISRYRELARGAIVGDSYGMLKLLVSTQDRTLSELVGEFRAIFRHAFREGVLLRQVRVRHVVDAAEQRAEHLAVADDAADRDAAEIDAVIAAFATDQARARAFALGAMIGDCHLQRGVDRFRSGIGEEDMVHALRRDVDQPIGQFEHDRMAHLEGRRIVELGRLVLDRLGDLRPAVAGIDAPETRCAVQHLATVAGRVMHVLGGHHHAWCLLELPVRRERHPECAEIVRRDFQPVGHDQDFPL